MKKRISALALSVVLLLSLSVTAFAASSVTDIKVTAVKDAHEITVDSNSSAINTGTYAGTVWTLNTDGSLKDLVTLFTTTVKGTETVNLGEVVADDQPIRVGLSEQGGSGRYYVNAYPVAVSAGADGSASVNYTLASANQTVTITASPSGTNVVDTIAVTDGSGSPVSVSGDGNSRTFTMPASNVTVSVTFKSDSVSVTGVTLNKSTLSLTVGGTETLTATVAPSNATDKSVTWKTSNPSVATVDTNGKVTAVRAGTATITVTTADGGKTATCTVTVSSGGNGGGGGGTPTYQVSVPSNVENGTVTVSPRNARVGATVTITTTPDEGYELDELTVTDKDGNAIELTDKGDGTYTFKMPRGKVTVDASFAATEQPPVVDDPDCPKDATCPIWPFTDASTTAWYHDGVHYCIENGIMNGYPGNLFGPDENTTRGQLVTMLHRLEGTPAPSGNQAFDDVPVGEWYAAAVRWAAENGIVNGYGNGSFGPNDPITREQLVTIMWRYAEYKGVDVSASADLSAYTDAVGVSDWAVDAMQWAVGEGVVNGTTTTTLSPQSNASRAQIATIFQRYCEDVVG